MSSDAYAVVGNPWLGHPGCHIVDVRFIPDTQTMVANVLAGEVDMTIGRGLSLEQGMTLKDRWDAGKVSYSATIPMAERTRALADIIHFQTEQALLIGTVFSLQPQPIPNRVKNAAVGDARGILIVANAHEWDVG